MSSVTHKAARLTYGICWGGLQAAPANIVMPSRAKHLSESQIKMVLSYFQPGYRPEALIASLSTL
jgi:hypothetical protein